MHVSVHEPVQTTVGPFECLFLCVYKVACVWAGHVCLCVTWMFTICVWYFRVQVGFSVHVDVVWVYTYV